MRLRRSPHLAVVTLGCLSQVDALIHEQVAFDSSNVCWWSLVPPDPICPVLKQQNLTNIVSNLKVSNQWEGGHECEGSYCLYSNKGFAGGRGIAVITNSESLAKVKQVGDLLQEYEISFDDDGKNVPFRTSRIKGRAIVATNALKRGDPIMAHTPVLLVHRAFRQDASQEKQQHLLDLAVDSLPSTTAKMLKDRISEHSSLHATFSVQSFEVKLGGNNNGDNATHDGVFPEAAGISHDCRPNTAYYVDPTTLMHIITAAQPIQPGHEITLSRLDPFATREERQQQAHVVLGHGAGCHCSQCKLPASEAADSETRLREIKWIESKLRDPASTDVSTALITYYLGLHENERLHCCLAGAYALAAVNFNMLGHDKHAVKYADLAIESFKMEKGEGVSEIEDMEALRKNAKGHATWKERPRVRKAMLEEAAKKAATEPAALVTPMPTLPPMKPLS